jgi:hypothetical protein
VSLQISPTYIAHCLDYRTVVGAIFLGCTSIKNIVELNSKELETVYLICNTFKHFIDAPNELSLEASLADTAKPACGTAHHPFGS